MSLTEKRQRRKEAMFELIDQQIKSGLSQIQFCKNQSISIATFSYWRQQYLAQKNKKKENTPQSSNHFIPIKIKTPPPISRPIEIQLPNKIILRCDDWQTEQLSTLISELQKTDWPC